MLSVQFPLSWCVHLRAWSWTPRISNALPYCSWWITGGSWSRNDFPLHCLLGCVFPPDFWWLFIFLMVVNVIKNQWKSGRMTDSGTWPRVSCSSHYPSIFLHRKYLLGSQVPISSSLCFLQRVCFVYSPNSHFWQPTTLLLLQRLLRLNSEIESKSRKSWLHWNFQDENELAKLLKKQGVAILFCEKIGSFLPSQTLDLLYKLLDVELINLGTPWEEYDCRGILKHHASLWYNVSCKKVGNWRQNFM